MEHIYTKRRQCKIGRAILLFVVLVAALIVGYGFWFGYQLMAAPGQAVEKFVVADGQGVNEVSNNLHAVGAIRSKLVFETYLYLRELEGKIKAGTYEIPSLNLLSLTKLLTEGNPFTGVRATLIEGWTVSQMADELAVKGVVDRAKFMSLISKPKANGFVTDSFQILYSKPDTVDLEGYLFPDTYFFPLDVTEEKVIGALITNLTFKLNKQMIKDMDDRGLSFHEILTMASIIEKEVRTSEDRRLVSGLLWKRIKEGIPLQVDSTVNYITGSSKPAVSIAETQIDNPFNTYQYYGLPPGPISNPGLDSIIAAIYPEESSYYFYLSTPLGETIFSETAEQHSAAKAKYLK